MNRFSKIIFENMFQNLTDKKILILGFSFKNNTDDTRESSAIYICRDLLLENAKLHIYDPKVKKNQILNDLKKSLNNCIEYNNLIENVIIENCPDDAIDGCHAIVILTEWNEFLDLNYKKYFELMEKPAFIFDGRRILDKKFLEEIGYDVFCIGT
jgi:UDPglucose 6-dehydrogenase